MDALHRGTAARTTGGDEAGFTIVELMVAVLIIVVGLLGTFVLLDGAQRTSKENRARIAAVNLGRQITEISRSLDYDVDLRPDVAGVGIAAALQSKPGLAGTGNPWPIVRRNNDGAVGVTYTTGVTVCTFDDPKDGLAPAVSAPDNACTPAATAIAGAPVETNPDDFRR
jgi:prepilin-type N-terminal cleavage/methylation domain-containing protein